MKTNLYVLAFIVFSLAACEKSQIQDAVQSPNQAIIGGTDTLKDNPTSRYLALILDRPSESYCTAMLIRNNILLTAAHCIKSGPENMTLAFGNRPMAGDYIARDASRILVHPRYNKAQSENRNDLALILIKGSAPEGYEALLIPDERFPFRSGMTFTSAGYGRVTGKNTGGDIQGSGTLRHVELKIDSLTTDQSQFYVDQTSGKGICNGDSGGPAMMRLNGRDYVVGIASAISWIIPGELSEEAKKDYVAQHDICMHKSIYISTKKYEAWIQEGVNELLK